ncbi:MAG: ACT domain-containing protein, partial [Pseudomonadota bacterium]
GIEIIAQSAGASFMAGRGAGAGPTASAVVADLIDIACGRSMPYIFGRPTTELEPCSPANFEDWSGGFYLRLVVCDKPGVLADIAPILRDHAISIDSMVQRGQSPNQPVKIIILTHDTTGKAINGAIAAIAKLDAVLESPFVMPILTL